MEARMLQETDRLEPFEAARPRLFGIAYRMLGSAEDAEDVLQEAWLRWHGADRAAVREPEAWLVRVVSRLAVDRLRSAARRRERYVGEWLPEPIATDAARPDRRAELASDLSMAFLVLLERLGPEERAAFLMRDVFGADFGEIARVLGKSEVACRQIAHRARVRVRGERARFAVPAETKARLLERFLAALEADDQEAVLALVAADATYTADGGGRAQATRRVVCGAWRIARLVLGVRRKWGAAFRNELAWVNGEPTIVTRWEGRVAFTTSIATDGERILAFYRVVNPEKLRHLEGPMRLA